MMSIGEPRVEGQLLDDPAEVVEGGGESGRKGYARLLDLPLCEMVSIDMG
jgi:hypothetical protein